MANYATLEDCKQWLGIPDDDTSNDDLLNVLLTNESGFIDRYCGYPLYPQSTFTIGLDGTGNNSFCVPLGPLDTISSLVINGQTFLPQNGGLSIFGNAGGYTFNPRTAVVTVDQRIPRLSQTIQITGTQGYAEIPNSVSQACTELVAYAFRQRNHIGVMSITKNGGMMSETTRYQQGAMPPEVEAKLVQYRRTSIWTA